MPTAPAPLVSSFMALSLLLTAAGESAVPAPETRTPAFPGAEGAGKWARGGRGGRVIAVTNLNDDGPGSLRAALEAPEPRTVIFRVSGTIELTRPLHIRHPFITVAGQTAPGDGICLKGQELQIGQTHDVVVRYLRCRPGDKTSQAGEFDAISVWDARDVIIDHCSATWSTDECLSVARDCDRVTVQHCLIAEALTEHAFGSIIAAYDGSISVLYNLYASNRSRNPRPGGYQEEEGREGTAGPRIDFRHNVVANWGTAAGYTGSGNANAPERIAINYVGNYLKPGIDTPDAARGQAFTLYAGATVEMHVGRNHLENPSRPIDAPLDLVRVMPGATLLPRDAPLEFEPLVEELSPDVTYERVLPDVGAVKPRRDQVDTRIVAGVRDGTGRRITTIDDDAWPTLQSAEPEPDQDGDGLPDAWERAHGLDETDPADAARIAAPEGWTNLELWLDSL